MLLRCLKSIVYNGFAELREKTKKAKAEVISVLTDKKINNCSLKIDLDHIMVANLLDKYYIDIIKKEITQE